MDLASYRRLVPRVATKVGITSYHEDSFSLDLIWPLLEKMRADGAVVLLKLDGERGEGDNGPYTALVSGKVLKGESFRIDAESMEDALAYIIVNYARYMWDFTE